MVATEWLSEGILLESALHNRTSAGCQPSIDYPCRQLNLPHGANSVSMAGRHKRAQCLPLGSTGVTRKQLPSRWPYGGGVFPETEPPSSAVLAVPQASRPESPTANICTTVLLENILT